MSHKTPLHDRHVNLNAKLVPFAGWIMPIWYEGLTQEHLHVRNEVGLFDVSHMGEIFLQGEHAEQMLQFITCNDISKLTIGRAQYNALLNDNGGVVDDIIIYKMAHDRFLICANAVNTEKVFLWIKQNCTLPKLSIENRSSEYGQIAIQGPKSIALIAKLFPDKSEILALKNYHHLSTQLLGVDAIVARTGYTGEDGFEIFMPANHVEELWDTLLSFEDAKPIGLAARDTLRIEAGYPLYGHELEDNISALESGLGWIVKLNKGDFIGRNALNGSAPTRTLVGLEVLNKRIARQGNSIFDLSGKEIGNITSGTLAPYIEKSIAIARVENKFAELGTKLVIDIRGSQHECIVIDKSFYKRK